MPQAGLMLSLSSFLPLLLLPPLTSPSLYPPCCPLLTVTGSLPSLEGDYLLAGEEERREEVCLDGCTYVREGEEYCFIQAPREVVIKVDCGQVTTYDASTDATTDAATTEASTYKEDLPTKATTSKSSASEATTTYLTTLKDITNARRTTRDGTTKVIPFVQLCTPRVLWIST